MFFWRRLRTAIVLADHPHHPPTFIRNEENAASHTIAGVWNVQTGGQVAVDSDELL